MTVIVTGAAGFIGMHVADALLARGETVFGIDECNAYYDPALKAARLAYLRDRHGAAFTFAKLDFADTPALDAAVPREHRRQPSGPPIYRAFGLGRRGAVASTDLELHRGEIVAMVGESGSSSRRLDSTLT